MCTGMEADREVALEMIKEADADGDGELTLAEFENMCVTLSTYMPELSFVL